uniref:Uncharacterized protein n=1 Tax=Romanomermis culicivorax TaxID=13658 RepID=A0A915IAH3_ROMCU
MTTILEQMGAGAQTPSVNVNEPHWQTQRPFLLQTSQYKSDRVKGDGLNLSQGESDPIKLSQIESSQ